ncbi:MAG: response regulator [Acidobacteria bacterium]|nr:response regulator [Acidobacteriota bacterium]MBV9069968.1 response regulator [Acidobacteriota bacterium]MBV9185640.1 response regulator [Acidobacteriota bacterium]
MKQERVLIVEDDRGAELILRLPLEREGFAVDFVEEGYAAIEKLRAHDYSAVILDLIIHRGLNGFGVLNFIDMEQPRLLERVFLMTGMSEQTVMNTAPQLLSRLFRKPFSYRKLVAAVVAVVRPYEAPGEESQKRLLVVDDDNMSAELVAVFGRRIGMSVDIAENGREGIERIANAHYDAVVLDLLMPGIDGFGVLEYLDRCKPEVMAHTIISSGLPEKYRERVAGYGVCGVVTKPLDHRALQEMLAHCIAGATAKDGPKQANGS